MLIQVGSAETLLSDATRFAERAGAAGTRDARNLAAHNSRLGLVERASGSGRQSAGKRGGLHQGASRLRPPALMADGLRQQSVEGARRGPDATHNVTPRHYVAADRARIQAIFTNVVLSSLSRLPHWGDEFPPRTILRKGHIQLMASEELVMESVKSWFQDWSDACTYAGNALQTFPFCPCTTPTLRSPASPPSVSRSGGGTKSGRPRAQS